MLKAFRRKPSASMVVAIVALVVAMSGTAVAGTGLVSGNKIIKKHSLSGNRLVNKTITRQQINMSKLGVVGKANVANYATSAGTAANATNATNASNASELGGQPASSYVTSSSNNIKTWFATASAGQTVTLLTIGPFTITGACTGSHASPSGATEVSTSQSNSWLNSYEATSYTPFNPSDGAVDIGNTSSGTGSWIGPYDGSDALLSGDGNTYANTFTSVGTGIDGADCVFVGYAAVVTR